MAIIMPPGGGGGWKTEKVAKIYTEAPPCWKFERVAELPRPRWGDTDSRTPGFTTKKGSTLAWWPGWLRTEIAFLYSEGAQSAGMGDKQQGGGERKRGRTTSLGPRKAGGGGPGTGGPGGRRNERH